MNRHLIGGLIIVASLFTRCSPSVVASLIVNGPKVIKSANARSKAETLKRDPSKPNGDSIKYARYFIYRSGSFVGSALSCLVYDNNDYVAVASLRTFIKVDSVIAGDHIFSSEVGSTKSVKFNFKPDRTYIIKIWANTKIKPGTIRIMDEKMLRSEIAKGNFFQTKFLENKLKVEDISSQ